MDLKIVFHSVKCNILRVMHITRSINTDSSESGELTYNKFITCYFLFTEELASVLLEGKTFRAVKIPEPTLKTWRKTEERSLVHFCQGNNIQGGYVFCVREISQFSTLSYFMESHFCTADTWHVYVDSFMTNRLFVLCRNKAPNCYTQRSVWSTYYYCVREKEWLWGMLSW